MEACPQKCLYKNVHSNFIRNSLNLETNQMFISRRINDQILYINTMEYDLERKQKPNPAVIHNNMDKFCRHYAEQRSERQGSTYRGSRFYMKFYSSKTHLF